MKSTQRSARSASASRRRRGALGITVASALSLVVVFGLGYALAPAGGNTGLSWALPWVVALLVHLGLAPWALHKAWRSHDGPVKLMVSGYFVLFLMAQTVYWVALDHHPGSLRDLYRQTFRPEEVALQDALNAPQPDRNKLEALIDAGVDLNTPTPQGSTPLLDAISRTDAEAVEVLVRGGADVNRSGKGGITPLLWAVEQRQPNIVKTLLDAGAGPNVPNEDGWRPLCSALHAEAPGALPPEQDKLARYLLQREANPNLPCGPYTTAIAMLVAEGRWPVIRRLIRSGVRLENGQDEQVFGDALLEAVRRTNHARLQLLLTAGVNVQATNKEAAPLLRLAIARGDARGVRILLDAGANPHEELYLHQVVGLRSEHNDLLSLMLEAKTEVNVQDERGATPLGLAALALRPRQVQFLLDAGADPNAQSAAQEPLLVALQRDDRVGRAQPVTELLLAAGIDLEATDSEGRTALIVAARRGDQALVQRLSNAGANMDATDSTGHTALTSAAWSEGAEGAVYEILKAQGGVGEEAPTNQAAACMAAAQGNVESLRLLSQSGADLNDCGPDPRSPALAAIEHSQLAALEFLLSQGADPNWRDSAGRSLLEHAAAREDGRPLMEVLLRSGADPRVKAPASKVTMPPTGETASLEP